MAYREEVLGRRVEILFDLPKRRGSVWYRGTIESVELSLDEDRKIRSEHLIVFDDGDEDRINLSEEDAEDRLKWVDDEEDINAAINSKLGNKTKGSATKPIQRKNGNTHAPIFREEMTYEDDDDDDDDESVEPKKKPGRKRKPPTSRVKKERKVEKEEREKKGKEDETDEPPKRKRGRPKKIRPPEPSPAKAVKEEDDEETVIITRPVAKKRKLTVTKDGKLVVMKEDLTPEKKPDTPPSSDENNPKASVKKEALTVEDAADEEELYEASEELDVEYMPESIDAIVRHMDRLEHGNAYYERQEKNGGCRRIRGKLRAYAQKYPEDPAVAHWVQTKKWQPPNAAALNALIFLLKSMLR